MDQIACIKDRGAAGALTGRVRDVEDGEGATSNSFNMYLILLALKLVWMNSIVFTTLDNLYAKNQVVYHFLVVKF